ncbi:hypothetical protein [Methylobacterium sp. ARG-1]|uniref:hypothetical protein n=1 Tax=Methylobacterium sp. ARG-1 TaxID=1692501 RepID=UPI000680FBE2|nr:hypothetical protein [Methylobacterium sp. ARG-1]KNY20250.1 hypothetical protein AKJ13_23070 [Methylobacterium sp. ARG-1]
MSFQPLQSALILVIELRRRHLAGIDTARELLAVLQRVLLLLAQRHTCSCGRLGALGPFRVADPTGIAICSEACDIFLEKRGSPEA